MFTQSFNMHLISVQCSRQKYITCVLLKFKNDKKMLYQKKLLVFVVNSKCWLLQKQKNDTMSKPIKSFISNLELHDNRNVLYSFYCWCCTLCALHPVLCTCHSWKAKIYLSPSRGSELTLVCGTDNSGFLVFLGVQQPWLLFFT